MNEKQIEMSQLSIKIWILVCNFNATSLVVYTISFGILISFKPPICTIESGFDNICHSNAGMDTISWLIILFYCAGIFRR